MKKHHLFTIPFLLAACTTTDEIIIDRAGVDPAKYQQDLAECREYSSEVKTGEKAARGAASATPIYGATISVRCSCRGWTNP